MKSLGLDQAFNSIIVYKMECNQKKLNKKPIQSTSNVDIDNLVELYFISLKKILMKKWICWNLLMFVKNYKSQNMPWQLFHLWMIWCRNPTLGKVWRWDSHSHKWELGVLRDSRNFRARQQRAKHLALRYSL